MLGATPLFLALTAFVFARCALVAVDSLVKFSDVEPLGRQELHLWEAFVSRGPNVNGVIADALFTDRLLRGTEVSRQRSLGGTLISRVMGADSMLLRVAPIEALQCAALLLEIMAMGLLVMGFGGGGRPWYVYTALLVGACTPLQDVDMALKWVLYAVTLVLMSREPTLIPAAAVLGAIVGCVAWAYPFTAGLLPALFLWARRAGRRYIVAAAAGVLAPLLFSFDPAVNLRLSLFDMHPHNGNSWMMYQLLFPRYQHAFFLTALVLCLTVTLLVVAAVSDRGTLHMPLHVAAVAMTAAVIFQPVFEQGDVLAALAFLGATPQAGRIMYGFAAISTLLVTTVFVYAYRFAWLQLRSMPQPNMAFYGGTAHQVAVAMLVVQFITQIVAEAAAARSLRGIARGHSAGAALSS